MDPRERLVHRPRAASPCFIAVGTIILAIIFALLGALARLSRSPVAFGVAGFYTSFFRGTPLLVQIFLIYFGVAEIGVRMRGTSLETLGNLITLDAIIAAILAIGLNYGAYMTEIFRAGIQSVGHGQAEAADALGMNYGQKMRRIVLPQAIRVIIPPTGNEFIAMTKDSAPWRSSIGVLELFRRADLVGREDVPEPGGLPPGGGRLLGAHGDTSRSSRHGWNGRWAGATCEANTTTKSRKSEVGGSGASSVDVPIVERVRRAGAGGTAALTEFHSGESVVKVKDLHKSFGDLEVLKGIDMEVDKGEVVVIFGRSGSGKSTLLRCVNFLEDPTSGVIEVAGVRLEGGHRTKGKREQIRQLRIKAGMVFQRSTCSPP